MGAQIWKRGLAVRYTIEGFSQTEAIKFRHTEIANGKEKVVTLDCTDLVILRWFVDFWPNMMKVEIGGSQYAWLSYKALIEDMPLIGIKKGMLALRLKKLVSFGILSHQTVKSGGTFSYYGFGPEYVRLVDTHHAQQNSDPAQDFSEGVPNKLDTPQQKISDQIDSSTKDPSTKNNAAAASKPPVKEIIAHLNAVTGKHYSPRTKDTIDHISARWAEYPDMSYEDRLAMFISAIDNMVECWTGTRWEPYLKPSTLFRPTKFDEYVNMEPSKWKDYRQNDQRSQYTEEQNQEFDLYSWDADQITYL